MKALLKDLKKGDRFIFNNTTYTVAKKFAEWSKSKEQYLKTTDGWYWYWGGLIVEKIVTK